MFIGFGGGITIDESNQFVSQLKISQIDNADPSVQLDGEVSLMSISSSGLSGEGSQFWHQGSGGILDEAEAWDHFGYALAAGDFNGDGKVDLAVGVPFEDIDSILDVGAVNIIYGAQTGLVSTGNQMWSQSSEEIIGEAEDYDNFGYSLAAGDFNGDDRDDIAIGTPGDNSDPLTSAGGVIILYGSFLGLSSTGDQLWNQGSEDILGEAETGDWFGKTLAAGDFNGDGRDDLAIGAPEKTINTSSNAGTVNILYGSSNGLSAVGNQLWHQDSDNIAGGAEEGDFFGSALIAGDFNGDGNDDLAVGVRGEAVGAISEAGAVNILYGSFLGLSDSGNQMWSQNSAGISGMAEEKDYFGGNLAAGDFNGDGKDDLAVGVVGEDISTIYEAGAVNILLGSIDGISATGNQMWHQDSPGIAGKAEVEDHFGRSLDAGDFNADNKDDLAVSAVSEAVGSVDLAGAVHILYGSTSSLTSAGNQFWHQNSPGIEDLPEGHDLFGFALAAGDFNGWGKDDLAIGVAFEYFPSMRDVGAVNILYSKIDRTYLPAIMNK
jgi:disulfide bond formation protein DsbB